MMKSVFNYFAVLFSICCFSQTNENIPTNKEIVHFLENLEVPGKEIKKIDRKIILWTDYDIYGEQNFAVEIGSFISGILRYKALRNYFKSEDLKFIEKQYLNQKDSVWQKNDFKKFNITDSAEQKKIVEHSKKGKKNGIKLFVFFFDAAFFT
ncbi:hypothetical protein [Flavobacterium salmonis]|uniref:Uncharacterized protein n=1 Tax=Flavobacterium salmonis TaxID=2654844 RepID=A0A6V6ZBJ0_9FLAO|nr:hypothetical protein [Flavobacterium salmonis]CAD0009005.1 hypothetical protein FLAT13_04684 [Flavobacterium salmonis]